MTKNGEAKLDTSFHLHAYTEFSFHNGPTIKFRWLAGSSRECIISTVTWIYKIVFGQIMRRESHPMVVDHLASSHLNLRSAIILPRARLLRKDM